ncbi:MAG: glycosyl hydrolase [Chitinophagaceae bacterium]
MKQNFLLCFFCLAVQASFCQLIIYPELNLQGSSGTCVVRTIYKDNAIPNGLNNTIKSITLSEGFMATLAENADGTGERYSYMATKSNLNVNLSLQLQNKVSFIRVLKLPNTPVRKKGASDSDNGKIAALKSTWFYDWGMLDSTINDREFVPMAWSKGHASPSNLTMITNKDKLTHFLAFNEPEPNGQSKVPIDTAIVYYKNMLASGYRTGSPSCKENGELYYLDTFARKADTNNLNVDFIGMHWYDWGGWFSNADSSANSILNRLKSSITRAYNKHHKPIWITEFNANEYRSPAIHHAFMQLALPWLDQDPRVERYTYFFGNDLPSGGGNAGALTTGGQIWSNHASVDAYPNNLYDTRTAYADTLLATWETSGYLQGGRDSTNFSPKWVNNNIEITQPFRRGSGVDVPTTAASNGYWGANDFTTTTVANAESTNRFLTFKIKSKNNKSLNIHSIDKFMIRKNNTGPTKLEIDFQIDNNGWVFADTINNIPTVTGNFSLGPIDLSKVRGLQNIPSTSTVTIRIVPYEATAANASFLIGNGTVDVEPDFTLRGSFAEDNIVNVSLLPVTLSNFKLKRNGAEVKLQWQTINESAFSHFEVEHSTDRLSFQSIAVVNGKHAITAYQYNYVHRPSTLNTTNYYRLKMVDKDGSYTYSNILVDTYKQMHNELQINSLVTNGLLNAQFNAVIKNARIKIINVNGQVYKTIQLADGAKSVTIDLNELSKGMYFLSLENNTTIQTKKFMKQ